MRDPKPIALFGGPLVVVSELMCLAAAKQAQDTVGGGRTLTDGSARLQIEIWACIETEDLGAFC